MVKGMLGKYEYSKGHAGHWLLACDCFAWGQPVNHSLGTSLMNRKDDDEKNINFHN